jgi:uncharacterized membrane protein
VLKVDLEHAFIPALKSMAWARSKGQEERHQRKIAFQASRITALAKRAGRLAIETRKKGYH